MAGNCNNDFGKKLRRLWVTRPYVFTEDVPNHWLALHSAPSYPHGLHQLGVGDDEILPIDEEDWELLFAQHIGCSDRSNEHLAITFGAKWSYIPLILFHYQWSILWSILVKEENKGWEGRRRGSREKHKKKRVDQSRGGEQERRISASTIGYHLKKQFFLSQ